MARNEILWIENPRVGGSNPPPGTTNSQDSLYFAASVFFEYINGFYKPLCTQTALDWKIPLNEIWLERKLRAARIRNGSEMFT